MCKKHSWQQPVCMEQMKCSSQSVQVKENLAYAFGRAFCIRKKPSGERREKGSSIFLAVPIAGQQTKKKNHRNGE